MIIQQKSHNQPQEYDGDDTTDSHPAVVESVPSVAKVEEESLPP